MINEDHVYKVLKTYLNAQNIKINEIADKAGITRDILYNVLQGRTALKADDFIKICNALGLTGDELLTYPTDSMIRENC